MECSHHILVLIEINACFPSDAAVHLGQQCRGDLYKINPPQIGSSGKTGQITGHSSSQRCKAVLPCIVLFN